jgi:sulfonate transport system substrate-binding protein
MQKVKKFMSFLLTVMFLVTVATGCSKSGNTSSSTDTANATKRSDSTVGTNAPTEPASKELKTLRVAVMTGMFNHYTALIGVAQGIYEKYGIKLEITEYPAGINTVDALVTGQADIGYVADFAIVNRIGNTLDSNNILIISEVQGGPVNGGLYVDPKYADDLTALDGKGFINTVGTVSEYYNSKVFEHLGFEESKQNLLNSDSPQTALALAEKGDAAAVFASGASAKLYENIGWVKAIDGVELGINTYSFDLATEDFNNKNPELIANYLKATQESYEYIVNNLDTAAAYLESTLGVDAEIVKSDWSVAKSTIGFSEEGATQLDLIEKWAFAKGKFAKEYNVRNYINTNAVKTAFPDKVTIK